MEEALDALEERIAGLRRDLREALAARDTARAARLRVALRGAERDWGSRLARPPARTGTIRAQVEQGLSLLGVPAAPRLVAAAHRAFHPSTLASNRMSSLRRDEERSYRSSAAPRSFYICPALTADLLVPARGLLTLSTWPLRRRVVGPLSARVDFLTAAVRIAEAAEAPADPRALTQLLQRLGRTIPGVAGDPAAAADPARLRAAAEAELAVHTSRDARTRRAAARRAAEHLDAAACLFGTRAKETTP